MYLHPGDLYLALLTSLIIASCTLTAILLERICDRLARPIPRWCVVMVAILYMTAWLQLIAFMPLTLTYVSGHYSRLGQEVLADSLNRVRGIIGRHVHRREIWWPMWSLN